MNESVNFNELVCGRAGIKLFLDQLNENFTVRGVDPEYQVRGAVRSPPECEAFGSYVFEIEGDVHKVPLWNFQFFSKWFKAIKIFLINFGEILQFAAFSFTQEG